MNNFHSTLDKGRGELTNEVPIHTNNYDGIHVWPKYSKVYNL